MDPPPSSQPPASMHKDPSRIAIEKEEWRKHAEKVLKHSDTEDDKQHDYSNPNRKALLDDNGAEDEGQKRTLKFQKGKLQGVAEDQYPPNIYKSTHYTWWNFIPKNLYEQFRRFTNQYFLLVTILTLTPFSPIPPYTSILPMVIVLTVSAVAAAIEDYRRMQSDKKLNNSPFYVLQPGEEWHVEEAQSQELKVGSLLYLESGDHLPADAILLRSSSDDGSHHAPEKLQTKRREELAALDATIEAGAPVASFSFSGNMKISGEGKAIPLSYANFLARGTLLRNTDWIIAATVFTGDDTKMSLNVRPPPLKFSSLDKRMNRVVVVLFVFMFALIVGLVLASFFFEEASSPENASNLIDGNRWYLLGPTGKATSPIWLTILRRFVAYFVLLSFIVPQSLMVMLDLCKAGQAAFIQWDKRMPGAVAKSLGVNDELGRVQFLFSDKTGTLTVNEMRFRRASAGGKFYESEEELQNEVKKEGTKGGAYDLMLSLALCHDAIAVPANDNKRHKSEKNLSKATLKKKQKEEKVLKAREKKASKDKKDNRKILFEEKKEHPDLEKQGKDGDGDCDDSDDNDHPDDEEGEEDDQQDAASKEDAEPKVSKSGLLHRSSSPDEEALLRAAARLGFELLENKPQEITLKIHDKDVKMEKLAVIPFSSARKRMSVVVKTEKGPRLICKDAWLTFLNYQGADSALLPRLRGGGSSASAMSEHIERMAVENGLRTLVIGARDLSQQQLNSWLSKWQEALQLTDEDEKQRRQSDLADEVERELEAIGATGIEDRLQTGVPETIAFLRAAGIRVWVITGDKPETAINIGYSCNLLNRSMNLCRIPQVASSAQDITNVLRECFGDRQQKSSGTQSSGELENRALVISGEQLTVAMKQAPRAFLEAVLESTAVLACRVTPLQKAELVEFVSKQTGATTLSIGDGANDVPMIHAGNIGLMFVCITDLVKGVGIFGKEGTQAVSASDFAVRRFKDLKPLLFVHGRNALLRNSALIQFQIYKNVAFFLPQVWFALWCGFSSTTLYEAWTMTFFNLLFTSLPPLFVGLFEQDIPREMQESHPEVYPELRSNWVFGYWTLSLWFFRGLFDATLIYFFALLAWGDDGVALGGRAAGLEVLGNSIAIAALCVVLARMALAIQTWNPLLLFGFAFSVVSFAGMLSLENWVLPWWPEQFGTLTQVLAPTPIFYIAVVFAVCAGSEFYIPVLRRAWRPDKRHILLEHAGAAKKRGLSEFPESDDARVPLNP